MGDFNFLPDRSELWDSDTKHIMSDEEYYEEEETTSQTSKKGTGLLAAKKEKGALDEQLREYINEWRTQRAKEEEELKRLKEKQAKRKEIRAEQEKKLAQQKKDEEERLRKEENEKKALEAEEKKKRLEEAEMKRQAMMQAQKEKQQAAGKGGGAKASGGGGAAVQDARREMTKTKEQLEEEKKISLSIRIKPLDVEAMDSEQLQSKAKELWDTIVRLETEKYDLTERQKRQDYDLKELKERQKQQLRQKAMKKGLDPEALTGKYPPKIRMYSKYERRTDTRTYEDRRKLYEGGWEVVRAEHLQALWKEKYSEWSKRPKTKLPKWFGERPGKKAGEPESPEDDDEGGAEAPAEVEEEEEEEIIHHSHCLIILQNSTDEILKSFQNFLQFFFLILIYLYNQWKYEKVGTKYNFKTQKKLTSTRILS